MPATLRGSWGSATTTGSIGVAGFAMRALDVPIAPAIVGLILGPLAEQHFRRALAISQGDPSVFVTHPIALALLLIAVLVVALPAWLRRRARLQAA